MYCEYGKKAVFFLRTFEIVTGNLQIVEGIGVGTDKIIYKLVYSLQEVDLLEL